MKRMICLTLVTGLFMAGPVMSPAAAQTASPTPAPAPSATIPSPLLSSWTVDTTRLPMPPEARPRSVTITYADMGDGRWRTEVEIVDPKGNKISGVSLVPLDGTQVEAKGSPEADRIASTLPQPNVLVTALAKGTVPASTRVYAVSADGQSMVETAVYFGKDGKSIMRTNYFTKTAPR